MIVAILVVAVLVIVAVGLVVGYRVAQRGAPPPEAPPEVAEPTRAEVEAPPAPEVVVERARLRDRLGRTRDALAGFLLDVRGKSRVDDETWEELEEALVLADVGIGTAGELLERVRAQSVAARTGDPADVLRLLRDELAACLDAGDRSLARSVDGPTVWLLAGVNGVGKTTTIAKLAEQERAEGRSALMVAADTFRAAAAEQLATWAERTGADIVRSHEGADPASVVFDAMAAATSRGTDLVLVDTAGRLHTKVNLMEELKKLRRVIERTPGALQEVLLVLDATTGQNGLAQARQFTEAVDVTGIVLTKLDGTARGGIVVAVEAELGIPVKLVGLGETAGDLVPFDPEEFAEALLAER